MFLYIFFLIFNFFYFIWAGEGVDGVDTSPHFVDVG